MVRRTHLSIVALFILLFALSPLCSVSAQDTTKDVLGGLRFRHIGPVGNRLTSVVGVPRDPNVYYVGAASGGVWKTIDGGVHWQPVSDSLPVSSIGALRSEERRVGKECRY